MKVYNSGQKLLVAGVFLPARRTTEVEDTPELRRAVERKSQLSYETEDEEPSTPPPFEAPTQFPTEPEPPVEDDEA